MARTGQGWDGGRPPAQCAGRTLAPQGCTAGAYFVLGKRRHHTTLCQRGWGWRWSPWLSGLSIACQPPSTPLAHGVPTCPSPHLHLGNLDFCTCPYLGGFRGRKKENNACFLGFRMGGVGKPRFTQEFQSLQFRRIFNTLINHF